jgi:hypothetical protein
MLTRLSTAHTDQRLRLAAGDRLMSLAPTAAAILFEADQQMDF